MELVRTPNMLGQEPRGRGHRCKAWTAVLVVVCVHLCRPWGAVGQRRVPPSFTSHRTAVQGAGEEAGRRARTPPTFTPARESGRAGGGVGSSSGASGNTPRPAASLVEERDLDEFSWAQTPAGLVAFDPAGCPCSTCLSTYGEALPDFPVLFAHILQPGGAAIVVGNGCGALPLVLAGLVRGHGQVLVYDAASRALEASLARKQNAAAARVVTLQRVCLRAPVDLSPDRVWGAAPACLKGYVGRVCDGNLSPTPAHTVWPWHDHQIQEGDEIASRRGPGKVQLVVISLEPHELAGFVAGLPLSLLLGGSCTLVIHCDYDAQAVVVEPITAEMVNRIRRHAADTHVVLIHIGAHWRDSNPGHVSHEHQTLRALPPPIHFIVTPQSAGGQDGGALPPLAALIAKRRAQRARGLGGHQRESSGDMLEILAVGEGGGSARGGHVAVVPAEASDAELSVWVKRVFVRVVPEVERFGTNPRMLFQRIKFDIPVELRTNLGAPKPFPSGEDTAGLHAVLERQQFPPVQRCHEQRLLVFRYVNAELSGHGSMFGHLSVALSAAVVTGRTLVVDDSAPWPFALCRHVPMAEGGCPGGFMTHYFAPLSSCSMAHVSLPLDAIEALREGEQAARVVMVTDDTVLPSFRMRLPRFVSLVPDEHAALLRWFAATSSFVLRPSTHLEQMVSRHRTAMSLPGRYIGMHVRRGHKWVETAAQPLDSYLQAAQELALKEDTRDVLVATEDAGVIQELAAMNRNASSALRFHWTDSQRRGLRISIPQGIRLGLLTAQEENEVSLVNLMLLHRCRALVATFSSGYGKRVLELMAANLRVVPLYVSLDHLWSP